MLENNYVDIISQNDAGVTALMIACENCCAYLVKYLLDNGANVYIKDNNTAFAYNKSSDFTWHQHINILLSGKNL